jgi:hypothetical protein
MVIKAVRNLISAPVYELQDEQENPIEGTFYEFEESMKDCSENTSSDLRNYFLESLFLNRDLYKVGLSEIIYMEPNTKSIVSEDVPIAPDQIETKTPKKFFGNTDGDNLVTIWKYAELYSEVVNNARPLNELQIILNENYRQINLNIQFVEDRTRGKLEGKPFLP